jgi:hypothetical protein
LAKEVEKEKKEESLQGEQKYFRKHNLEDLSGQKVPTPSIYGKFY